MAWLRGPLARLVQRAKPSLPHPQAPRAGVDRGDGLATRATGPPGAGGSTIVTPRPPRAEETEAMAWLRGPLARLVRNAY
ncbi:hypothetical protein [Chloroflexus sp. Y-396-1]|uniref:hypothetical protein n=1 Tax=Chloroflexus sp. Y-396-1 TaxID=867845 RepID=UPI0004910B0D|nr:hypothetical protein [Chloroflexus sp. Y-396-1]